jgi:hypothetical protein
VFTKVIHFPLFDKRDTHFTDIATKGMYKFINILEDN